MEDLFFPTYTWHLLLMLLLDYPMAFTDVINYCYLSLTMEQMISRTVCWLFQGKRKSASEPEQNWSL